MAPDVSARSATMSSIKSAFGGEGHVPSSASFTSSFIDLMKCLNCATSACLPPPLTEERDAFKCCVRSRSCRRESSFDGLMALTTRCAAPQAGRVGGGEGDGRVRLAALH
eukprot:5978621-Prymnesium_polylepis.2